MSSKNSLAASNSRKTRKPVPGSKGDPRMNRAVAARLKDPDMSLLDALRAGGFTFPEGQPDGHTVDSDNVQLVQRKNQLNRRLRSERWRHEQKQRWSDGAGSNKNRKRNLTSSPTAIEHSKRRNMAPDPDLGPFSTLLGTRRYYQSSPLSEVVQATPQAISSPSTPESVEQAQVVPLQQRPPQSPRTPSPIPLADISLGGQEGLGMEYEPGDYKLISTSDVDSIAVVGAEGGDAGKFCGDENVDEEAMAKHFLLKTFNVNSDSDPTFTGEERQEEERGKLPDELAAVLADVRGKHSIGTGTSTGTNAVRRESILGKFLAFAGVTQMNLPRTVPLSIESLLQEMRDHIAVLRMRGSSQSEVDAAISWDLHSQSNNDRLQLFLRWEDMDAKLAAIRFVKYWTKRYELFGREKFRLPMTLDGAMRDDICALGTGTFRLMPDPDSFGRRILFKANCFNTKHGYSSDSMVRVCWYMLELLLEDPITARKGFVLVSWDRDTSMWNCDGKLGKSFIEIESECMPIRFAALHFCSCTNLIINLFKPIVLAMLERRTRSRTWWHRESGEALFCKLGGHGITQDMVPKEMGGTSQFSHLSWLRERIQAGK